MELITWIKALLFSGSLATIEGHSGLFLIVLVFTPHGEWHVHRNNTVRAIHHIEVNR
jgi:hypothetical protein